MITPGGFVAYDDSGTPVGMGPTKEAAIAEARFRGCMSGRLKRSTLERVRDAAERIPAAPRVTVDDDIPPPRPLSPDAEPPGADYFAAAKRGDFRAASRAFAPGVETPGAA